MKTFSVGGCFIQSNHMSQDFSLWTLYHNVQDNEVTRSVALQIIHLQSEFSTYPKVQKRLIVHAPKAW